MKEERSPLEGTLDDGVGHTPSFFFDRPSVMCVNCGKILDPREKHICSVMRIGVAYGDDIAGKALSRKNPNIIPYFTGEDIGINRLNKHYKLELENPITTPYKKCPYCNEQLLPDQPHVCKYIEKPNPPKSPWSPGFSGRT
jgi:hypothetical protein